MSSASGYSTNLSPKGKLVYPRGNWYSRAGLSRNLLSRLPGVKRLAEAQAAGLAAIMGATGGNTVRCGLAIFSFNVSPNKLWLPFRGCATRRSREINGHLALLQTGCATSLAWLTLYF